MSDPNLFPAWAREVLQPQFAEEVNAARDFIRQPQDVMSTESLRAMGPSRLSFANTLIRRMVTNRWSIERKHTQVAVDGTGFIAYEIDAEGEVMHFGAFSYAPMPPGHQRLFRDTRVEFFGALVAGPMDIGRLKREQAEFDSHLWRGRTDTQVFGWTVASRSARTFDDVVNSLAVGQQPDSAEFAANGGYIIRNGGFYGNGRLGTRAWQSYAPNAGPLSTPYHVDLFCLYLWRLVGFDFVEGAARARSVRSVSLDPELKRYLGVGNSSGLGTVAGLIRWPARLSAYMTTRELAFAYVKSRRAPIDRRLFQRLASLLSRAEACYTNAAEVAQELTESRQEVRAALRRITDDVRLLDREEVPVDSSGTKYTWMDLIDRAETYGSREAVELLHSLLLELYPEVDALSAVTIAGMSQESAVRPEMSVGELRNLLEKHFDWILALDLDTPGARKYFWYRSEENGENRRGERAVDLGVERETFVDVAGLVSRLYDFLLSVSPNTTIARFLLDDPEHSLAVSRVQLAEASPFSEIRASVCSEDFLPSYGIRCFLTVLGLELPEPHSGRWVRGVFYRGAPLPDDILNGDELDWILPLLPNDLVGAAVGADVMDPA